MSKSLPAFGFLTALEDPLHGFFGGYLVISELGRPVEFHCSTPVMPNHAQRILYGKTLTAYVLSDLIGQTLLTKSQLPVQAVLTDNREMLGLTLLRDEVILCIEPSLNEPANESEQAVPRFQLAGYELFGTSTCAWRSDDQRRNLVELASHVDLMEPFERIREAIREAQRVTEVSMEGSNDSAAA